MKFLLLILVLANIGCASFDKENTSIDKVVLEGGDRTEKGTRFVLINYSKHKLMYEHWFGQEGMPVAYCDDGISKVYVCSVEVFLLEDHYYTHETVIEPKEKIELLANVKGVKRIGVKFYHYGDQLEEIYVWKNLGNGT